MSSFYWNILSATKITVSISLLSMMIGIALAILLAVCELTTSPLKHITQGLSSLIRALPDILIIFGVDYIVQFMGSKYLGLSNINAFVSGTIALSIIIAAFCSQIIIASYKLIAKKQMLAAQSLGMNKLSIYIHIVFPQVAKSSLPMVVNLFLVILKDSSIVSLIGLNDIMNEAHLAASETFNAFNYYGFAAIIYLVLSLIILIAQKKIKSYLGENYVQLAS